MKRRDFIKDCAAAGAMILLPNQGKASDGTALQSIAHPQTLPEVPTTCDELRMRMELLFSRVEHTVKAYEEWTQLSNPPANVCRVVPITYAVAGDTEAQAVEWAWQDIAKARSLYDARDSLLWRITPYLMDDYGYDEFGSRYPVPGPRKCVLRMRFGVIPHDYRAEHAFTHGGTIGINLAGQKPEGQPIRIQL